MDVESASGKYVLSVERWKQVRNVEIYWPQGRPGEEGSYSETSGWHSLDDNGLTFVSYQSLLYMEVSAFQDDQGCSVSAAIKWHQIVSYFCSCQHTLSQVLINPSRILRLVGFKTIPLRETMNTMVVRDEIRGGRKGALNLKLMGAYDRISQTLLSDVADATFRSDTAGTIAD